MLKDKVMVWGPASGGWFRVRRQIVEQEGPGAQLFRRWADAVNEDGSLKVELLEWGGLKKPSRAVEKLVRSYGDKVYKLLDICRQSIVFDSTQDIANCLQLVLEDEDVHILSVKNRLSRDYDDRETVGYRDVNLNLRFKTTDAEILGVENHVCELQLLLKSFAQLKSDSGHARYVKFRNARAL
mmetsp:Transcript_32208/g.66671  ORF Transcript_32208/g.66671 Transcript_32208/m.66671 type:complete len:183 (-) Transcript_32208:237-785(-)